MIFGNKVNDECYVVEDKYTAITLISMYSFLPETHQAVFQVTHTKDDKSFILCAPWVSYIKNTFGNLFYFKTCLDNDKLFFFKKAEPPFKLGDIWYADYKSDFMVEFKLMTFTKTNHYKVISYIYNLFKKDFSEEDEFNYLAFASLDSNADRIILEFDDEYKDKLRINTSNHEHS